MLVLFYDYHFATNSNRWNVTHCTCSLFIDYLLKAPIFPSFHPVENIDPSHHLCVASIVTRVSTSGSLILCEDTILRMLPFFMSPFSGN